MASKNAPKGKCREVELSEIENAISDGYNKIDFKFKKRPFKLTDKQKDLISIINNPDVKVVIIQGPAGTGKSWTSVYSGLSMIKNQKYEKLLYVRAMVESASKSMGYLPGSEIEKTQPFNSVAFELINKIVEDKDLPRIKKAGIVDTMPVNHARGHTWDNTFVFVDETQQMETKEILTVMSRIGENSKLILAGDHMQPDIAKSGFLNVYKAFNDQESIDNGIITFEFDESDIVRSEVLKFIIRKFKTIS
jgi:phosphate starvation-inducible PhoH-like protein